MREILKLTVIITILFFLFSSSAFALNNIYIDAGGIYINNNDMGRHIGGGFGIGYNLVDNFNIIHRQSYSEADDIAGIPHLYITFSFGLDYTWFFWNRFGLRGGFLAGIVHLENTGPAGLSDIGFNATVFTGIQFHIKQYLAVFIDVGFHYDYFSETFSNFSIYGETVLVGLRFTIGRNKRISDGY